MRAMTNAEWAASRPERESVGLSFLIEVLDTCVDEYRIPFDQLQQILIKEDLWDTLNNLEKWGANAHRDPEEYLELIRRHL